MPAWKGKATIKPAQCPHRLPSLNSDFKNIYYLPELFLTAMHFYAASVWLSRTSWIIKQLILPALCSHCCQGLWVHVCVLICNYHSGEKCVRCLNYQNIPIATRILKFIAPWFFVPIYWIYPRAQINEMWYFLELSVHHQITLLHLL